MDTLAPEQQHNTPPYPLPTYTEQPTGERANKELTWLWALTSAAMTLALVSVAFNLLLLSRLQRVSQVTDQILNEATEQLDTIATHGLTMTIPISQTVPFSATIPFQDEFDFPFKQSIPFNRTIHMEVDTGLLGKVPLDIPIYTTVPISITVPVEVDQDIDFQQDIPVNMTVPVHIDPVAFEEVLTMAREWLRLLSEQMANGK